MDRDTLINQVKNEYGRIASADSQQRFHQTTTDTTAEAYYENLLSKAISEINKGKFDDFKSGKEIVTAIANDKTWLSGWKQRYSQVITDGASQLRPIKAYGFSLHNSPKECSQCLTPVIITDRQIGLAYQ